MFAHSRLAHSSTPLLLLLLLLPPFLLLRVHSVHGDAALVVASLEAVVTLLTPVAIPGVLQNGHNEIRSPEHPIPTGHGRQGLWLYIIRTHD